MTEQITLTYKGRRLGQSNKILYVYEHEGRQLIYSKVSHGVVGGRYAVDADLGEEGAVDIYPSTMRYTGEKIDDLEQVAAWEAADRDAWNTSRQLAVERKHAKSSELDVALEPIVGVIQKASTRAEAHAIIRVISEKLDRAWWERE